MKKILFGLLIGCTSSLALSAQTIINAVPANWNVENYVGGVILILGAPTNCANGRLTLQSTASEQDKSRFLATMLSAKLAGKPVYVTYDNTKPNECPVLSFGLPPN